MRKGILLILFLIIVIGGTILYFGVRKQNTDAPSISTSSEQQTIQQQETGAIAKEISFPASDGYVLSATYWPPQLSKSPALILVHQYGSNRHDFDSFIPKLQKAGYAILAYDIRGFGLSQNGPADINDFPNDVRGAVDFLSEQPEIDSERIGVIGASVGANVAFVSSGSIPKIKAAVALSPSNTGKRGVLLGREIPNFAPHNLFIASDEREQPDADFIFSLTGEKKEQKVYPGFDHGIGILKSPEAQNDIINFLKGLL